MSGLEEQILRGRREVSADSVSMSISELTSLYKEGVLDIRPEFQRLYRWDLEQKSRLVESVLLGIPLPSFFVAQSETGKWELVDGLQRTSTLLELQGLLKNADGDVMPPLVLAGTQHLTDLDGKVWDGASAADVLSEAQKLDIRLSRLDIRIIKRDSDPKAKFDLFQRLNSLGSALTGQEIRNALITGINADCMAWLSELAKAPSFVQLTNLSTRQLQEQYDAELVLRFLMLHDFQVQGKRGGLGDFSSKIDEWTLELATHFDDRSSDLKDVFYRTFDGLSARANDDEIFRKWDQARGSYRGGFSNTAFEVIALGAGYCVANGEDYRTDVGLAAKTLWTHEMPGLGSSTGLATGDRLAKTIPFGRKYMAV